MPKLSALNSTSRSAGPVGGRAATAADFGGGGQGMIQAGKDLAAFGDKMQKAQARVKSRTDTIARTRDANMFNEKIATEFTRRVDETDMSDPENAAEFDTQMREWAGEIMGNHTGSEDSRARLMSHIENIRSSNSIKFSQGVAKAGRDLVNENVDNRIGMLSKNASDTGDIGGSFKDLKLTIDDSADAMTGPQEKAKWDGGRATITETVFEKHMASGDIDAAELALNTPGIEEFMTPDKHRQLRSKVIVQRNSANKGRIAGEQEIIKTETIIGRKMTDEERMIKAGLGKKDGEKSLQDEVNEFTTVFKRPPNETELQKLAGVFTATREGAKTTAQKFADFEIANKRQPNETEKAKLSGTYVDPKTVKQSVQAKIAEKEAVLGRSLTQEEKERELLGAPEGSFGNSLVGLAKDYTATQAPAFANRGANEDEEADRLFMNHVQTLLKPIALTDPITKETRFVTPKLTFGTEEALHQRGIDPDDLVTSLEHDAEPEADDALPFDDGTGMFDNAEALTGITSAAISAGSDLPGVADVTRSVFGSEKVSQVNRARSRFTKQLSGLVRTMQESPRMAEAERKQIREDLKLDLVTFSDANAMRDKLVGLDEALATQFKVAEKTLKIQDLSQKERLAAMLAKNQIEHFRTMVLRVPPIMTPQEAAQAPAGTKFRTNDGRYMAAVGAKEEEK
tara:strand:+ start:11208 stop:13256 length:2049 start_codon:yes stop_codon:yes gene_type:complete